jgi:hypothetical protein
MIVVIGRRDGRRHMKRHVLRVPLALAQGHYEDLSDLQLQAFIDELTAEHARRRDAVTHQAGLTAKCADYDPFASQIRRAA